MAKLVQITVTDDEDTGKTIYALDEEGNLWSYWEATDAELGYKWHRIPTPDDQENLKERA